MLFKVALVLLGVTFCSAKVYTDCGSQAGSFVSLKLNDCDVENRDNCAVYKGENINVEITFKNVTSNKVIVHATISDTDSPGPNALRLVDAEGCSGTGIDCPLQSDKTYTYKASVPAVVIHESVLKWDLDGDRKKNLICLEIKIWTEVRQPGEK